MKTDFKVYPRKIHVWIRMNSNVPGSEYTRTLAYLYSTNAYKTCKAAIEAAKAKNPAFSYVAQFAKD